LWVLFVVRYRSLQQADPSSREVLQSVMFHCVWSRNLKKEAALARVGLLLHGGKNNIYNNQRLLSSAS
jgi:hypothetical protein